MAQERTENAKAWLQLFLSAYLELTNKDKSTTILSSLRALQLLISTSGEFLLL